MESHVKSKQPARRSKDYSVFSDSDVKLLCRWIFVVDIVVIVLEKSVFKDDVCLYVEKYVVNYM